MLQSSASIPNPSNFPQATSNHSDSPILLFDEPEKTFAKPEAKKLLGLDSELCAEEARKETQLRLTALLDSAMDGIITLDSKKRILMCNAAVENMFGHTAGELVGKSISCLLPQGFGEAEGALSPVPRSETLSDHLRRLCGLRSNGEQFPIEASISSLEVRSQRFLTLTLRDISQRTHAEQAFAESQERLRQSQKMAVVGHLTGGVVHDFNNLLTIIGGHAELLLASLPPDAPMRDSLYQIRSASSRAASLTRQLLAFSRKQAVEPRILDLNTVVKDTEKMIRRLVGEDILLQTSLASHLSQVKVDPSQMDQVILNLVVNARDAMPKGGRLTIKTFNFALNKRFSKTCPGANPGNYVALVVNDNGCGMTSDVLGRIFEPFFTTKNLGKGTGLGLTVVHGIVAQSGGYILVDSEPGAGTTFKIYLPAAHGHSTHVAHVEQETNARGCETVLLVEDEETLRNLGAVVLQSYGYNVLTAGDGKEALRLTQRHRGKLDLLLTDVVLPGISGCELATTLRRCRPDLKVLFLSGYTEEDILSRGILKKGSAFLNKPFSPVSLVTKIRRVLDEPSQAGTVIKTRSRSLASANAVAAG